ncbi:NADH-quinone oxidoreductase subunit L [Mycobacteroides abscessus subsp. abscessus]|nr:NADH-quinone oxidoreductase subunit L [Mycobacteroides abscessus subsp. abscessus]
MGGLFYKNKFLFVCFAIGGGALAAIPFLTIGFFSKDAILAAVWTQSHIAGIPLYNTLYWVGVAGAFLKTHRITRSKAQLIGSHWQYLPYFQLV